MRSGLELAYDEVVLELAKSTVVWVEFSWFFFFGRVCVLERVS